MIELKQIGKIYKLGKNGHEALKNVSLSFRDNEFAAILGPSGSGKTTLLNIIGGLDRYTSGDLVINGISTKKYLDRDWDAYRNHTIGFIFQSYNLIQHQTVLSNVELALTISGVKKKERRARAIEALKKVGLGDQILKKPNQLSGGQMQRVAIARALINDPAVLLADEPTGALDSKTSIQVMDLLKEVAKDRLVIMVTHNAELAAEYASRIVELKDGEIQKDSDPFVPETAEPPVHKKMGRASMGFFTALALSFHNLRTKKARTILTAFAGSIGIIGIALILSLSTGVRIYTDNMEKEMLADYPIQVRGITMNMDAFTQQEETVERTREEEQVYVYQLLERLFSMTEDNDLRTLKTYIDEHPEKLQGFVESIEYSYSVQPQIYKVYEDETYRRVNPDSTMEAAGMSMTSLSALIPSLMTSDVFFSLPADEGMYEKQFKLVKGSFPKKYNECLVVLSSGGGISDFALYDLGLRDPKELDERVKAFLEGRVEHLETPAESYSYDDLMGLTFRLITEPQCFTYEESYGVWSDRSTDEEFMRNLLADAEELKVVGIALPSEDSAGSVSTGIGYPFSLIRHVIAETEKSEIVQAQLADPETDVFTGKPFGESGEMPRLDMSSLVDMDPETAKSAIHIDFQKIAEEFTAALDLTSFTPSQISLNPSDYLDMNALIAAVGNVEPPDMRSLFETLEPEEELLQEAAEGVLAGFETFAAEYREKVEQGEIEGVTEVPDEATLLRLFLESEDGKAVIRNTLNAMMDGSENQERIRDFFDDYQNEIVKPATDRMKSEVERQLRAAEERVKNELARLLGEAIKNAIVMIGPSIADRISIDTETFLSAFHLKMTAKELNQILTSLTSLKGATYEDNLKKLGYASLDDPSMISIYPVDFEGKGKVLQFLNDYNDEMERAGNPDAKIAYTDTIGSIMETITLIITIVTSVLMATVGVSLVVSSIMIGIITYISVLERKKEIGILRALGASKRNVAEVFNAETLITGFLAGLIGVVLTYLILIPGNIILHTATGVENVSAVLRPEHAVILVAISMLLTLVGGLIPSRKASKNDPVEALRTE